MFSAQALFLSIILHLLGSTAARHTNVSTALYTNEEFILEEISSGMNFTTNNEKLDFALIAEASKALSEANAALHNHNAVLVVAIPSLTVRQSIGGAGAIDAHEEILDSRLTDDRNDIADIAESNEANDADDKQTAAIALACFVLLQLLGSSKEKKKH